MIEKLKINKVITPNNFFKQYLICADFNGWKRMPNSDILSCAVSPGECRLARCINMHKNKKSK